MSALRQELRLEVSCNLGDLARATELLDSFWRNHDLDEDVQADLNIAIEEIVSNVIRHGEAGERPIVLLVGVDAEEVRVEVRDAGQPFDPLAHAMPDPGAPLEERRGGGLGIFMVTQMMDHTSYKREGEHNCFRMTRSRTRKS